MRFPWVSRELYEGVIQLHNATAQDLKASFDRFDALLEKYHELAKGSPVHATEPHELSPAQPLPERVPSVVAQAIKDESGDDPRLARVLWKRARELRALNMKPDEIAAELRRWQTTEVEDVG